MALFNYECDEVKRKIDEVSPNYPQLTTFEKEWLFFHKYHYIPGIPVELEYETVTVNPYGRVDNAIPFNYKSAILKGNSRVNLVNDVPSYEVGNYTGSLCKINVTRNLENETLTIIFNVTSLEKPDGADGIMRIGWGWTGTIRHKATLGVNKVLYNDKQTSNSWLGVYSNTGAYNLGQRITISDVMVLEGDYTNIDIPYFEGMQSVKMPVLTTNGENLFDVDCLESVQNSTSIERVKDGVRLKANDSNTYRNAYSRIFKVEKGKYYNITYTVKNENPNNKANITLKDMYGNTFPGLYDCTITGSGTASKTFLAEASGYVRTHLYSSMKTDNRDYYVTYTNVMISEVSSANDVNVEYKPYTSRILTVNEDVELRGIGEVRDTVDLMTGELTQRIGEVVLDGTGLISKVVENEKTTQFGLDILSNGGELSTSNVNFVLCNAMTSNLGSGDEEHIRIGNDGKEFYLWIKKEKLTSNDVDGLRIWLQSNPLTIQYPLRSESIKTVDLEPLTKPYEGTNYYQLSSNIPCEAILEVPVVSTGEQTLEEINND